MVLTCSMRSNQHEFLWDWDDGLGSFLVKMECPGTCQACPCAERNGWQDAGETIPVLHRHQALHCFTCQRGPKYGVDVKSLETGTTKQLKPQARSGWEAEGAFQQRGSAAPIFVAQIMYSHGVVTSLAESILNVQAASYNYCRLRV